MMLKLYNQLSFFLFFGFTYQGYQGIPYTTAMTLVKQLSRFKIQSISPGKTHTAAIDGRQKGLQFVCFTVQQMEALKIAVIFVCFYFLTLQNEVV